MRPDGTYPAETALDPDAHRESFADRHYRAVGFLVGALVMVGLYPLIDALLDKYIEALFWAWTR